MARRQRAEADTERTRRATENVEAVHAMPHEGETYRCESCGMEMQVTADCGCEDPETVHLECCGHALTRV